MDNALAYIFTDCEGGNPVSAPGVGGTVSLVTVDLGRSFKCSLHFKVAVCSLVMYGDLS